MENVNIEIGMYIRGFEGISRITKIENHHHLGIIVGTDNNKGNIHYNKDFIGYLLPNETNEDKKFINDCIKKSPIDLIKSGDIITFVDDDEVYKVICVPNKEVGLDIFYLAKNYDGETEDISVEKEQMEKYIESILTKEQFERERYKIRRYL